MSLKHFDFLENMTLVSSRPFPGNNFAFLAGSLNLDKMQKGCLSTYSGEERFAAISKEKIVQVFQEFWQGILHTKRVQLESHEDTAISKNEQASNKRAR